MSIAAWSVPAAGMLIGAAAVVSLWRSGERHPASVRRAFRWFGLTAACWAAGLVVRQVAPPGAAGSLSVADLLPLLALVTVVAGLRALAPGRAAAARDPAPAPAGLGTPGAGGLAVRLADGYLLAAALFLIGWVTIFAGDYGRWDEGPGVFAAELMHPLADALVLGWVLPLAVAAGRRALAPCLALLAVAAADALDVAARVGGGQPGLATGLLLLAAIALLGLAPLAASPGWPPAAQRMPKMLPGIRPERDSGAQPPGLQHWPATAILAAAAAIAAALAVIVWGLAGSPGPAPVVAVVGGSAALALGLRAAGLAWRQRRISQVWRLAGEQFRELADRTSDVVLVVDRSGLVRYASPAVADYGYSPDKLAGVPLASLLHPEDQPGAARAASEAASAAGGPAVRYPCRVRAADGTWRHVQATLSRHRDQGGTGQLLITARDVSDQVALRRQVEHLTFHDGLTGLPNRAYIEDRARAALAALASPAAGEAGPGGGPGAAAAGLILLDLDGFTAVNDSAGHSAGDLILAQAARRLRAVVPPADTVARWGGDEFAALIEASTTREVIDIGQRLAASISAHAFRVGDRELALTASVGVALADGSPPGYVWRNADVAMSRAKDAGGGRAEVYAPGGEAAALPRLALAGELQQAIEAGRLSLSYQPVLALASGRVASAVAEVRMSRDGLAVPAAEFLTAAEASGLVVPLGEWALREACAEAGQWQQAGLAAGVWVKVSPAQAVAPRFAESVLAALAGAKLPAASLTLEVTERDLVHGGSVLLPALAEIRAHGVRLAIGDFGTDYASLSYLRRRPVDVVKIDSEFVGGLGLDAELAKLVEAIVRVGRDLGIDVVAAGISQPRQLAALREMGCEFGAGELVAPGASARELRAAAGGPVRPAGALPGTGETIVSHTETKLLSS